MKYLQIFTGIFLMFYSTACATIATPLSKPLKLASNEPSKINTGGNPEVINDCFGLQVTQKNLCFKYFFPKKNLLIHPSHGEIIRLAGRGESIEKRELHLNNEDELVLLYLDTTNVKIPLSTNIKATQFTYDKNTLVLNIKAKDIKDKIILSDNEGTVLLEYTVKR
ncbi:MAG: Unknown protein [uncultured Sulfurovum sp.]|uniref:Lipoprotein n=1 Tax=uncultured Sulfurovum sp. TaxID=269237 RepID=A0A6S6S1D7_9BACT|nr:MAG: Unknown protein [uncultured Sulfurovum sp.]